MRALDAPLHRPAWAPKAPRCRGAQAVKAREAPPRELRSLSLEQPVVERVALARVSPETCV